MDLSDKEYKKKFKGKIEPPLESPLESPLAKLVKDGKDRSHVSTNGKSWDKPIPTKDPACKWSDQVPCECGKCYRPDSDFKKKKTFYGVTYEIRKEVLNKYDRWGTKFKK